MDDSAGFAEPCEQRIFLYGLSANPHSCWEESGGILTQEWPEPLSHGWGHMQGLTENIWCPSLNQWGRQSDGQSGWKSHGHPLQVLSVSVPDGFTYSSGLRPVMRWPSREHQVARTASKELAALAPCASQVLLGVGQPIGEPEGGHLNQPTMSPQGDENWRLGIIRDSCTPSACIRTCRGQLSSSLSTPFTGLTLGA